jgi:hypothetical protein
LLFVDLFLSYQLQLGDEHIRDYVIRFRESSALIGAVVVT